LGRKARSSAPFLSPDSGYDGSIEHTETRMSRLPAFLIICACAGGNALAVEQVLDPDEIGVSATAQITYSLDAKPRPERLDFDFRTGDSHAWINDEGTFQVTGWIKHNGLLCATYRMGVRFGAGSPGCLNVEWITEPLFVTFERQCNDARVEHTGGDDDASLGKQLAAITCAERVVHCAGHCK